MLYVPNGQLSISLLLSNMLKKTKGYPKAEKHLADFLELRSTFPLKVRCITNQKDITTPKNTQSKTSFKHIN